MVLKTHLVEPFREPLKVIPPVGQPNNLFFLRVYNIHVYIYIYLFLGGHL